MRHIVLLGSTGSIGTNTLDVIARYPEEFKVMALAGGNNIPLLAQQIQEFSPRMVSVKKAADAITLRSQFPGLEVLHGPEGLLAIVNEPHVDTMVSAIDGTTALAATLESIRLGHRICLANKETLVAAGELINHALSQSQAEIIPIDSEQSAIFQCLGDISGRPDALKKVILTASGGPFFKTEKNQFTTITIKEALNHPTWSMGVKVTIDSATLMNKALEVIEAFYLFRVRPHQIDVVIHPQSIVHSMVEFSDSSIIAQLSLPDMKLPILYSLSYPRRIPFTNCALNFSQSLNLEFYPVDQDKFPSIPMAFYVLKQGKNAGAILNAANEVAVKYYLQERISFAAIFSIVGHMLYNNHFYPVQSITELVQSIEETKRKTEEYINQQYPG